MNKQEILKRYSSKEDQLLVAKMFDQFETCQVKKRITYTDFLDIRQKELLQKAIQREKIQNYLVWGGYEEAERVCILFYPSNYSEEMIEKNYAQILQVIQITLPNDLQNQYSHRDYLGGIMKLGIKREKIGDIMVHEMGADLIIKKEMSEFLENNLRQLIRFQKANICCKSIQLLKKIEVKVKQDNILVSSMRLDNIISELAKTSREKAKQLIAQERVFVNFEMVNKDSKLIQCGDRITIRGKGRFKIIEQIGNTKKGRIILQIEKNI